MKPAIDEWIAKAEGDYASALRELRARKNPNYDSACFHAQQCVEKYLKGLLQVEGIPFAKTHELPVLLDACRDRYPTLELFRTDLELLTQYAVALRYPGETATKRQAKRAVDAATRLRVELRKALKR